VDGVGRGVGGDGVKVEEATTFVNEFEAVVYTNPGKGAKFSFFVSCGPNRETEGDVNVGI